MGQLTTMLLESRIAGHNVPSFSDIEVHRRVNYSEQKLTTTSLQKITAYVVKNIRCMTSQSSKRAS